MKQYSEKINKEMTIQTGETYFRRSLTQPFCKGNGIDIGSQGSPVNPDSIQIEYDRNRFDVDVPIQWEGDGTKNLPFKNNVLDYVYSSHLLEDYIDWVPILSEWNRVIKCGGYIVIMVPDKNLFRDRVRNGQPDNPNHKHESYPGELTKYYHQHFQNFTVVKDEITDGYNILFVAKKDYEI
jgi:predicted SAM-dependent methyltransferase